MWNISAQNVFPNSQGWVCGVAVFFLILKQPETGDWDTFVLWLSHTCCSSPDECEYMHVCCCTWSQSWKTKYQIFARIALTWLCLGGQNTADLSTWGTFQDTWWEVGWSPNLHMSARKDSDPDLHETLVGLRVKKLSQFLRCVGLDPSPYFCTKRALHVLHLVTQVTLWNTLGAEDRPIFLAQFEGKDHWVAERPRSAGCRRKMRAGTHASTWAHLCPTKKNTAFSANVAKSTKTRSHAQYLVLPCKNWKKFWWKIWRSFDKQSTVTRSTFIPCKVLRAPDLGLEYAEEECWECLNVSCTLVACVCGSDTLRLCQNIWLLTHGRAKTIGQWHSTHYIDDLAF